MRHSLDRILLGLVVLCSVAIAAPNTKRTATPQKSAVLSTDKFIDANRILMFVTNDGEFATDVSNSLGKTDGLYYPYSSVADIQSGENDKSVIYAAGIWMGAVDSLTGDTLITLAEYGTEYYPGSIVSGAYDPAGESNPAYTVYKVWRDSLYGPDSTGFLARLNWPVAQGAPVDSNGRPAIDGDQFLWSVYNDGNPAKHTNDAGSTAPLGVEVQQSTFAYNRSDVLGDIVFIRFKILNKGGKYLRNMFVSLWSDPDLGGASDDLVGCDTNLSLGYCYNATNADNAYGVTPPAVGFDFFQGPLVFTGNSADIGRMWGTTWPGYQNLGMSSFNKYINGTDPAHNYETYYYMSGLTKQGAAYVYNGDTLNYAVSGDPVSGTGDLDANAADRRLFLTTGPFSFNPGDSTEIVAAVIVGQCGDRIGSVASLKYTDAFAQTAYNFGFDVPEPPASPEVTVSELDGQVTLTWDNISEIDHGDYPFEGYTIFQGSSSSGPFRALANFDLENGIQTLNDEVFDPALCLVDVDPVRFGKDTRLKYIYTIDQDQLEGSDVDNLTDYFYKVEAYSYDPDKTPRVLSSGSTYMATPQKPLADVLPQSAIGDTIVVTHTGVSDGQVRVSVYDPLLLTGDAYTVTFDTNATGQLFWRLRNTTDNVIVLDSQYNTSGDSTFIPVEGMFITVQGTSGQFKDFQTAANGAGPLTPPGSAAATFQGFPASAGDPDDDQQVGDGHWLIHTGDNGGTADGGSRGGFTAFLSRCTRDGGNNGEIGIYDYEIRFTASSGLAWNAFTDEATVNVPFELWNIGIGTPDNAADDFRLVPWLNDVAEDGQFSLESFGCSSCDSSGGGYEHSASGGSNDPYTDWIYWMRPDDVTPGQAGYNAAAAELTGGTYDGSREHEVFARMVLVNWNGGIVPPFNQAMPEEGTVFRIVTQKPITQDDVFAFSTTAPSRVTSSANDPLKNVRAVPNPYYLYSDRYDSDVFNRQLKFSNLPEVCTIKIYNLAGDLVDVIEKNSTDSYAVWDIETSENIPIASGVYLFVVDGGALGQKVGKVAVFVEAEQLKNY
jgi:hypothetical protein